MKTGIYKIQNMKNGRLYIGSSLDVDLRLRKHKEMLRRGDHVNSALQNAFKKHGEDLFSFEKILVCEKNDLLFYEQLIMDCYKSYVKPFGYNIRKKAESNAGIDSKKMLHKPGDKYGKLTFVSLHSKNYQGNKWNMICDCGNNTVARAGAVKYGKIQSCGCIKTENISKALTIHKVGDKYGRLTLVSLHERRTGTPNTWVVRCDCGVEKICNISAVKRGNTSSCGCYQREKHSIRYKIQAYPNEKYNKLTLLELREIMGGGKDLWLCRCDCGREVIKSLIRVKNGKVKSCGCLNRDAVNRKINVFVNICGEKITVTQAEKKLIVHRSGIGNRDRMFNETYQQSTDHFVRRFNIKILSVCKGKIQSLIKEVA